MDIWLLVNKLFWPLLRLLVVMSLSLVAAHMLEALGWTRFMTRLASPLARMGHLGEAAGASFALAFISPAASNALLAESHASGKVSRRELIFANLFNSSPTFLVHLPTLFSLSFAFLGAHAFTYVGLTFAGAALRTACTMAAGRALLPKPAESRPPQVPKDAKKGAAPGELVRKVLRRVKKRILKLILFTVPIYCGVFAMQQAGWFTAMERLMADHISLFPFLRPEALGIVVLHLAAEAGAAFAAASPLLTGGSLTPHEVIMALLVGNILSSPMRAFRHQFPSYAGYFSPGLAFHLVLMNQLCRVASLALVAAAYWKY